MEDIDYEILYTFFGAGLILIILFSAVVAFAFVFQRRQQSHKLEKANLQAQFKEEILTAKNEVQENTMRHIAREIHDNIGQMLSLIKIQLNTIDDEHPGIKRVGDSKEFLSKAIKDLRGLSKTLNSDNILNGGLVNALDFEVDRLSKVGVFNVEFQCEVRVLEVDAQIEIIVFRIFQEIVQNVIKHSGAKNLKVSLQEKGEVYTLDVLDDGCGFDFQEKSKLKSFNSGAGLANLLNRAKLISGDLEVESSIGKGTHVKLSIPKITTSHDESRPD